MWYGHRLRRPVRPLRKAIFSDLVRAIQDSGLAAQLDSVFMKWISLFLIAYALDCSAQSVRMGITSLLPNTDSGNGGLILAQQTTLTTAAALQSISFYVVRSSGTLRLGLYDAKGPGGNPGNRLTASAV